MTTPEIATNNHINILQDFQDFLRNIWKCDGTRPSIYSSEVTRYTWDRCWSLRDEEANAR